MIVGEALGKESHFNRSHSARKEPVRFLMFDTAVFKKRCEEIRVTPRLHLITA
jgi:ATP-dependent RNA circularization protein (DNA/RNA ligase family)